MTPKLTNLPRHSWLQSNDQSILLSIENLVIFLEVFFWN